MPDPTATTSAKNILIDRESNGLIAIVVDGQRVIGFDRKNALVIGAAICKTVAEWDDLPWVVEHV